MHLIFLGLSGWVKMQGNRSEEMRLVDTALTVLATLGAATTWALLRH